MKSSLTTATCTSTIAIVNVTSKVAAFAFFLASVLGVVYGNTYVSLSQKERISCESYGQFTFDDESVMLNAFGFISVYIYIYYVTMPCTHSIQHDVETTRFIGNAVLVIAIIIIMIGKQTPHTNL